MLLGVVRLCRLLARQGLERENLSRVNSLGEQLGLEQLAVLFLILRRANLRIAEEYELLGCKSFR